MMDGPTAILVCAVALSVLSVAWAISLSVWALRRVRHAEARARQAETSTEALLRLERARLAARVAGRGELAKIYSLLGRKRQP